MDGSLPMRRKKNGSCTYIKAFQWNVISRRLSSTLVNYSMNWHQQTIYKMNTKISIFQKAKSKHKPDTPDMKYSWWSFDSWDLIHGKWLNRWIAWKCFRFIFHRNGANCKYFRLLSSIMFNVWMDSFALSRRWMAW